LLDSSKVGQLMMFDMQQSCLTNFVACLTWALAVEFTHSNLQTMCSGSEVQNCMNSAL